MRIASDHWLAKLFGYPVFNITVLPEEIIDRELREHIRQQEKAFYCVKVPTNAVSIGRQLQDIGFYVIDANAAVQRPTQKNGEMERKSRHGICVKKFSKQYESSTLNVSKSCFRHSRFHLDPVIPDDIANTIKYEWVKNYTTGARGDQLFVAVKEEQVIGFLAALVCQRGDKRVAVSDLLGVDPNYQRLGIGRLLLQAFIDEYKDACDILEGGGVYLSNAEALRLHEKMGFVISSVRHVWHMHV